MTKQFLYLLYTICTVMITITPVDKLDIVMESITLQCNTYLTLPYLTLPYDGSDRMILCSFVTITPVLNFLPITITLLLLFNYLDVKNI